MDSLRLLSLKARGQHLQEESTLAELGIENDEEVALSHLQNGVRPRRPCPCCLASCLWPVWQGALPRAVFVKCTALRQGGVRRHLGGGQCGAL